MPSLMTGERNMQALSTLQSPQEHGEGGTRVCDRNMKRDGQKGASRTDPPTLAIDVHTTDVLCQVGAGAEAGGAAVPAAGIGHTLSGGRGGASLAVHHGRRGASAGCRAVHVHQGAADAAQGGEWKKNRAA